MITFNWYSSLNSMLTECGSLFPPPIISMEWGLEGYHLWMVAADSSGSGSGGESSPLGDSTESSFSDEAEKNQNAKKSEYEDNRFSDGKPQKPSAQLMQFQFVKSALTVNPCMVSAWDLFCVDIVSFYVSFIFNCRNCLGEADICLCFKTLPWLNPQSNIRK